MEQTIDCGDCEVACLGSRLCQSAEHENLIAKGEALDPEPNRIDGAYSSPESELRSWARFTAATNSPTHLEVRTSFPRSPP